MPYPLAPTDLAPRQVAAVAAELGAKSPEVRLDPQRDRGPDGATQPRFKRVVAFMGTNDLSCAATRPLPPLAPDRAPVRR